MSITLCEILTRNDGYYSITLCVIITRNDGYYSVTLCVINTRYVGVSNWNLQNVNYENIKIQKIVRTTHLFAWWSEENNKFNNEIVITLSIFIII